MTTEEIGSPEWSFPKRLVVRFGCIFFGLYFFPFPLDYLPFMGWLSRGWEAIGKHLVIWVGAHVLRLGQPIIYEPTGSGDTLHDWVFAGLLIAISTVLAILWSILGCGRKAHPALAQWLRVYLRYALAAILLSYGFSKVFPLQFSPPGKLLLAQPLGKITPMMLAWTFMGYSVPYTVFAGTLECLGGLLLLFRRTTTLGALVSAAVMTNVVMMNFCYDIPVKLHSSLYLLMALVILAPSLSRIANLLVFHRPARPEDVHPPRFQGWRKRLYWAAKALIVGWIVLSSAHENWVEWRHYREIVSRRPDAFEGFYEIQEMKKDGVEVPRLYTDGQCWRWVAISKSYLRIGLQDGSRLPTSRFTVDMSKRMLTLLGWDGPKAGLTDAPRGSLGFELIEPRHLILQGTLDGAVVEMHLEKRETSDFPLMARGFHWISEHPHTL